MSELTKVSKKAVEKICPICTHIGCDRATEIYIESDKEVVPVIDWFASEFKKKFKDKDISDHFKNHIDKKLDKFAIVRSRVIGDVKSRAFSIGEQNTNRTVIAQQMIWDMMEEVYINREKDPKTKDGKIMFQKQTEQFVKLSKMHTDNYKMQLEMLGMNKTEEEMNDLLENLYVKKIREVMELLDDFPEAQARLSAFMNIDNTDLFDDGESSEE